MKNDNKLRQLRVLIDRISENLGDIERLHMASLTPLWPDLEASAKAITEDLRIALPLAAQVAPVMVQEITTMKEAVVNMRIDTYNAVNDVTAGEHQEPEVCEAMKAYGITDPNSQRGIEFCICECRYIARCIVMEPTV